MKVLKNKAFIGQFELFLKKILHCFCCDSIAFLGQCDGGRFTSSNTMYCEESTIFEITQLQTSGILPILSVYFPIPSIQ